MVKTRMRLMLGLAALASLAACGGESTQVQASGDLQRDLQLASGPGIELLPNASRTTVVSAVEQAGVAEPAPAPTRTRAPAVRPKPRRVAPQSRVVRAPAPTPGRQVERPEPRPTYGADVISPPPPGGYKTVDEVIRNAPFPIKP
ncbi:MAG: hypothetical protein M3303_02610 [Gemmatimonadota bacterium]|nr:hypothetical protein [Gemmatimonadota bacterium]